MVSFHDQDSVDTRIDSSGEHTAFDENQENIDFPVGIQHRKLRCIHPRSWDDTPAYPVKCSAGSLVESDRRSEHHEDGIDCRKPIDFRHLQST